MTKKAPTTQTISSVPMEPLRWLFVAKFKDGEKIVQTQEDQSATRTDGTGSTFTDVLAREDDLVSFSLFQGDDYVTVDLISGNFDVNGTPVCLHDQFFEPLHHKLRLIYFRETRIDSETDKDQNVVSMKHYVNRYFIGWQTTANGKNVKVTLAVG